MLLCCLAICVCTAKEHVSDHLHALHHHLILTRWLWLWSWCVCAVWCGTLKKPPVYRFKTPPCVHPKRLRVCRHHAHMLKLMCAWCQYTRGHFERTHEGVLDGHTPGFVEGRRVIASSAHQEKTTWSSQLVPEVHLRNFWICPTFKFENRSRTTCSPLYLIKLFNSSSPEGHCGGNQL